jgi:hypothetical protein
MTPSPPQMPSLLCSGYSTGMGATLCRFLIEKKKNDEYEYEESKN